LNFLIVNVIIKVKNQRIKEGEKMNMIDKKRIPISSKRQITIPVKYFNSLDFDSELECICTDQAIILKPVKKESGHFAQEILNDLIDEGYSGEELKKEFANRSKQIRPAVKRMIAEATENAKEFMKNYKDETDNIFNTEDD
jgi:bifunctional DNA-binding transcriptional regulator/antitoxin component of YhaV-PrlF toxin-antitoxin module